MGMLNKSIRRNVSDQFLLILKRVLSRNKLKILARKSGVKRISKSIFIEIYNHIYNVLKNVIKSVLILSIYNKSKVIKSVYIVLCIKKFGKKIYGFRNK